MVWDVLQKHYADNASAAQPETVLYCAFVSSRSTDKEKYEALVWILEARKRAKEPLAPKK